MRKPKTFLLETDMFPHVVAFYYGPRPSDAVTGRLCRKYRLWNGDGDTPGVGDGQAVTLYFGTGSFVWIDSEVDAVTRAEHFAHEMVHVISGFSKHLGEYPDEDADELHAYYAGWLAKEFFSRVGKV